MHTSSRVIPAPRTDLLKSRATKGALDTFVSKVSFRRVLAVTVGALRALLQDSVHLTRSRRRRQHDDATRLTRWRRSRGRSCTYSTVEAALSRPAWRFCSNSVASSSLTAQRVPGCPRTCGHSDAGADLLYPRVIDRGLLRWPCRPPARHHSPAPQAAKLPNRHALIGNFTARLTHLKPRQPHSLGAPVEGPAAGRDVCARATRRTARRSPRRPTDEGPCWGAWRR